MTMNKRYRYRVLHDFAHPDPAHRPARTGDEVALTAAQARYLRLGGRIAPAEAPPPAPPKRPRPRKG